MKNEIKNVVLFLCLGESFTKLHSESTFRQLEDVIVSFKMYVEEFLPLQHLLCQDLGVLNISLHRDNVLYTFWFMRTPVSLSLDRNMLCLSVEHLVCAAKAEDLFVRVLCNIVKPPFSLEKPSMTHNPFNYPRCPGYFIATGCCFQELSKKRLSYTLLLKIKIWPSLFLFIKPKVKLKEEGGHAFSQIERTEGTGKGFRVGNDINV